MNVPILECQNLSFHYPRTPHKKFAFSLRMLPKEFIVVIGKSGAGKSTFFSLLAGFHQPTSGFLKIDGSMVQNEPPSKRALSLLFQSHNLFPHLTVFQNVSLGISSKLRLSSKDKREVMAILDEMNLSSFADKQARFLSGGEMQRTAVARCLLQKKPLLLLDEPFSSLDQSSRAHCHKTLYEKSKARGLSLLFITHFPEEVIPYSDRVIKIDEGKIME